MKLVDLSIPLSNDTSTYPTDPEISIIKEKEIETDRTLLHRFTMGSHTGTHLDAPAHIIPGGKTLSDFPLTSFLGNAVKVDKNSYESLDKVEGEIEGVIYDTGWYRKFNNSSIYYGRDRPAIPIGLVEKLTEIGIKFFGCDLPSVDASGSKEKPIHNLLLGAGIIIYESLTNLNQLTLLTTFYFYGFPLPFKNLDGCPVRAIALL